MTFSYRRIPIKKYGRNEGHHYNPTVITAAGKMHQQMPKLVGESLRKNGYLHSLKISPPKDLVISKGKIVTTQRRILSDTILAEG